MVVIEAERVAQQASGRNGGFCSSSLTHGLDNGVDRFPGEIDAIEALGAENFAGIEAALDRYGIECDWWSEGGLSVATEAYQVDELAGSAELHQRFGVPAEMWDRDRIRAEIDSPPTWGSLRALRRGARRSGPPGVGTGGRREALGRGDPGTNLDAGSGPTPGLHGGPNHVGHHDRASVILATNAFRVADQGHQPTNAPDL